MTPYQACIRWPEPVKKRCFDAYMQHLTVPEITAKTKVPVDTVRNWIRDHQWKLVRDRSVTNWEERALATSAVSIFGLSKAAKTACLLLEEVQACLDKGETLTAAQVALLAKALNDTSEPLLRMFGK